MRATGQPVTLNNGVVMPALGFGTFQIRADETADAVAAAITCGYRMVDTAAVYGTEQEVGEGIRRTGIARSEMFITTKLWIEDYGYEEALAAVDASLERLGVEHVDLYLLHWPMPKQFDATVAAYRAAEQILADGRARAIGVSNFAPAHLAALLERVDVVPAVNQVELHPWFSQRDVRAAGARCGVLTQPWSPLGGVHRYSPGDVRLLLEDPTITALAAQHRRTPAQVVIRWHLEHGLPAIPKSADLDRIAENSDVFDFELDAGDMAALDALDTGVGGGPDPEIFDLSLVAGLSEA